MRNKIVIVITIITVTVLLILSVRSHNEYLNKQFDEDLARQIAAQQLIIEQAKEQALRDCQAEYNTYDKLSVSVKAKTPEPDCNLN